MPRGPNGTPTCLPCGSVARVETRRQTPTTLRSAMSISLAEGEAPRAALRARQHGGRDEGEQRHQADDDERVGEGHTLGVDVQDGAEIFQRPRLLLLEGQAGALHELLDLMQQALG